jgi:tetratricopeptide (TPR) repeat protein
MATAGYLEVEDSYLRALDLCDRLGDSSRRFPALWGLWLTNVGRGAHQRLLELAEQVLSLAKGGGNPTHLLEAHHAMWTSLVTVGRLAEAAEHCRHGVALYDRRERRSWWLNSTHDPGVCCRNMLGVSSWLLGHPDGAVKWIREALNLAGELRHPFTTVLALHDAALVHYHRGEAQIATETANAALEIAHAHGLSLASERTAVVLGRLVVDEGRVDEGLARAEEAARQVRARGASSFLDVINAALLAGAYGIVGQPENGLQVTETLAARGSVGFYQPEIHRVRGELFLLLTPGNTAEAEACFRSALELARARDEKSLELRAAMSLARLLRPQGKREEARSPLATLYAGFAEGLETADLREARALLDELA